MASATRSLEEKPLGATGLHWGVDVAFVVTGNGPLTSGPLGMVKCLLKAFDMVGVGVPMGMAHCPALVTGDAVLTLCDTLVAWGNHDLVLVGGVTAILPAPGSTLCIAKEVNGMGAGLDTVVRDREGTLVQIPALPTAAVAVHVVLVRSCGTPVVVGVLLLPLRLATISLVFCREWSSTARGEPICGSLVGVMDVILTSGGVGLAGAIVGAW